MFVIMEATLAQSLIADVSVDSSGAGKPTDPVKPSGKLSAKCGVERKTTVRVPPKETLPT